MKTLAFLKPARILLICFFLSFSFSTTIAASQSRDQDIPKIRFAQTSMSSVQAYKNSEIYATSCARAATILIAASLLLGGIGLMSRKGE